MNTYAVYAKDEKLRLESSSGAVICLLANSVIDLRGIVYGVAMSNDCRSAVYCRVNNGEDLSKLRGSKYLQAIVGDTYKNVKNDLQEGYIVLFSGTSCQINGLKSFLGKEYENLYCVDVICHGTPSPKLWRKYVDYLEKQQNAKLISVNFRCKDNSWKDFGIKRIDEHHKAIYVSKDTDPYMVMFLRDYCLRPSCYECVAKSNHKSDLTIADFWGIDNVAPEMNDGKGTSLVITRTDKGDSLFEIISKNLIKKAVTYEAGVSHNPSEYSSVRYPNKRNCFYGDLDSLGFDKMIQKYGQMSIRRHVKVILKNLILKTPARKLVCGGE